jgi:hypothetical protein
LYHKIDTVKAYRIYLGALEARSSEPDLEDVPEMGMATFPRFP